MPRLRKLIPAVSFAWAFGLIACGVQESASLKTTNTDVMTLALGEPEQGKGEASQEQGQADQGQAAQEQQEQQEQQGQQEQQSQVHKFADDASCDAIHAKLVVNRTNLQATSEWQALEKTKEYAAFDGAVSDMQESCSDGHDATHPPSAQCIAAYAKFKADLVAMKATPEWEGVKSTPAYTVLTDTYDEYHAAGCGHSHASI